MGTAGLVPGSYLSSSVFGSAERNTAGSSPFSMSIPSVHSSGEVSKVEGRQDSGERGDKWRKDEAEFDIADSLSLWT